MSETEGEVGDVKSIKALNRSKAVFLLWFSLVWFWCHDSREIFVRASHDSRETFVGVSHDVRANFNQFKSRNGLIYVAYLSHCGDRGKFLAMCLRTSVKGWRRVHDICDDLGTVLRLFLSHKKVLHV